MDINNNLQFIKDNKIMCPADGIKHFRKKSGLSQKKFGESLGVALTTVQSWEYGQRVPSKQVMMLLQNMVSPVA